MIVGIGIDLVETPRFRRASARFGVRLAERLFTEGERSYADRRARALESLAVRFAAKRAARRALGAPGLPWREVEVVRNPGAAPTLRFHGRAARAAEIRGVTRVALTLTHDASACVAQVVLEAEA